MLEKIQKFFINKFPTVILSNELVASVIYVTTRKFAVLKEKVDKQLNTDV